MMLTSRNCLAPGLLRRQNHLAKNAAVPVYLSEIDLLDRIEAYILAHHLGCDQDDRRTIAIGFIEAIDEVEAAGAAGTGAGHELPSGCATRHGIGRVAQAQSSLSFHRYSTYGG
jgi:hypothetical protein